MSNELEIQSKHPARWSLVPNTLGEANEIARLIADSDFAPKDYRNKPSNVIIAIQMGLDLGLKPLQALQHISVINGRPSVWGDAALALVMPILERFKETIEGDGDKRTATCIAKRRDWPDETVRTFSVADAKKAGLWGKSGPWTNYSDRMLMWRARGFCLRDVAPDRLMGLVLAEEAQDYIDTTVVPGSEVHTVVSADPLEGIDTAVAEAIGKGFEMLSMSEAQRLVKVNEFVTAAEDKADGAAKLLDWLKDEYAKRKFGQPRKKNGDNSRELKPIGKAFTTKPAEEPKSVGASSTVKAAEEPKPEPPAPTEAPTADEIF